MNSSLKKQCSCVSGEKCALDSQIFESLVREKKLKLIKEAIFDVNAMPLLGRLFPSLSMDAQFKKERKRIVEKTKSTTEFTHARIKATTHNLFDWARVEIRFYA